MVFIFLCAYIVCVFVHTCEFKWSFPYRGDLFIPETMSFQIKSPEPDMGYLPSIFLDKGVLEAP